MPYRFCEVGRFLGVLPRVCIFFLFPFFCVKQVTHQGNLVKIEQNWPLPENCPNEAHVEIGACLGDLAVTTKLALAPVLFK